MLRRKTKKRSEPKDINCYFPQELWTENILPRLPVKSLLIFRSVCKSWCSTIDDPAFIFMHRKLSKSIRHKNKLLAIEKVAKNCIRRVTLRRCDSLRRCANVFYTRDRNKFLTSCNGLFLVRHGEHENLKLWNLSIKKSLLLPPCPFATDDRPLHYLFGFKPSSNDYVVYAFLAKDHFWPVENLSLAVYTLSDNLWRIRNDNVSFPSWIYQTFWETPFGGKYVCFGGALHWFGNDRSYTLPWKTHLLSFNFDTEKFSYVEVPDTLWASPTCKHRFLFVLGESLATLSISSESNSIWVLKNGSWELKLSKLSNSVGFDYIADHPRAISNFLYSEDGGITLVYEKISYNVVTDELKHLTKSLSDSVRFDTYAESLALHRGCEGQILTSL